MKKRRNRKGLQKKLLRIGKGSNLLRISVNDKTLEYLAKLALEHDAPIPAIAKEIIVSYLEDEIDNIGNDEEESDNDEGENE